MPRDLEPVSGPIVPPLSDDCGGEISSPLAAAEWSVLNSLSAHIVLLDRDGTILAANDAWRKFAAENSENPSAIAATTGVGANYLETCRASEGSIDDEARRAYDGIKSVLDGHTEKFTLEYRCHSLVEERWFSLTCTPVQGGQGRAVVTHVDISPRIVAEHRLRNSEENYRNLFQNNPVPMWVQDRETTAFLEVNDAAMRTYGYSRDEFLTLTVPDLRQSDDDASPLSVGVNTHRSIGATRLEEHRASGGSILTVEVTSHELEFQGRSALLVMAVDVTERSLADAKLRTSEARYRLLFDDNPSPMIIYDFETMRFLDVNEATRLHYGYSRDEFLTMKLSDIGSPVDVDTIKNRVTSNNNGRTVFGAWKHRRKDGSEIWVETASHKLEVEGENSRIVLINDVTEKKRAEDELREAEQRFRATFERAAVGIAHIAPDGRWLLANERLCEITGYSREELAERTFYDIIHPDDHEHGQDLVNLITKGDIEEYSNERRYVRKDCEVIWIRKTVSLVREADMTPKYLVSIIEDITERKSAEEELLKWAAAFENCAHGIVLGDPKTERIVAANAAFAKMCGRPRSEIENSLILSIYDPKFHKSIAEAIKLADNGYPARHISEITRPDGHTFPVQADVVSVRDASNEVIYRVATIQDISARKEAEDALRESEAKLRLFVDFAPAAVAMFDRDMKYMAVSQGWRGMLSIKDDIIGKSHYELFPTVSEACKERHRRALGGAVEKQEEEEYLLLDGTVGWFRWEARPWFNSNDEIGGIMMFSDDITERKAAAEELRRSEEKLRQSQKMEAVGRLAGGIAHDFNNMLTVIKGYSEMGLRELPEESRVRHYIESIRQAGERSSSLTQQLLAFSRTQIVQPEILEINQAIKETLKMLKYIIGEDIGIQLELSPDAGSIEADPGHISQVLMNLLVNARDAMPVGGSITISTEKVRSDDQDMHESFGTANSYVRLSVADNGSGMDEATRDRIFDPFFTTKEAGEGTGLGLSTVYGIVKKSGGHINVRSKLGEGTTFILHFPLIPEEHDEDSNGNVSPELSRGTGRILVVEDEDLVRNLTRTALESFGYSVVDARNGVEAIKLLREENLEVDLLMTDMVMPEMSGIELYETLTAGSAPVPKFLFMSGYIDDDRVESSLSNTGENFIQKPFKMDELLQKIQQMIGAPGR